MNSTQQKHPKSLKIASIGGKFYIRRKALHRKTSLHIEEKEKLHDSTPVVRNYDEAYLFHLFCCANGRMPELFSLIQTFPPKEQAKLPKSSTLYKIASENDWRVRFEEIRLKMRQDFESRNGLSYTKIDQLASYLLQGTMLKFVSALREENYKDFNVKDLKSLWHMTRTERGLAPTVPYKDQNQENYSKQILSMQNMQKNQDSGAGPEFYERLNGLTPEELKAVEYVLTGSKPSDDEEIPSIIRKR